MHSDSESSTTSKSGNSGKSEDLISAGAVNRIDGTPEVLPIEESKTPQPPSLPDNDETCNLNNQSKNVNIVHVPIVGDQENPSAHKGTPPTVVFELASRVVSRVLENAVTTVGQKPNDKIAQSDAVVAQSLATIWCEPPQFADVYSVLSTIWHQDSQLSIDTTAVLSAIWLEPAVSSVLSDIWRSPVFSYLSQIWREAISEHDVRCELSRIWSRQDRCRLISLLSAIWQTPAVQAVLSAIWHADQERSLLSEIWLQGAPVRLINVRCVLSQIWQHSASSHPLLGVLERIWQQPVFQSLLVRIWQQTPRVLPVLQKIWATSVEKLDPRSVLSQIWSSDEELDNHLVAILSAIWTEPALRPILSSLWAFDREVSNHHNEAETDTAATAGLKSTRAPGSLDEGEHSSQAPTGALALETLDKSVDDINKVAVKTRERIFDKRLANGDCLRLCWAVGRSRTAQLLNLTTPLAHRLAYLCGHVVVVYDYGNDTQSLLHGHQFRVVTLCVSNDGRWIASADFGDKDSHKSDSGSANSVIVWDAQYGRLIQVSFNSQINARPVDLAFTGDSRFLLILQSLTQPNNPVTSASDTSINKQTIQKQQLLIWEWTIEDSAPIPIYDFSDRQAAFHEISASVPDPLMFVVTSEAEVMFLRFYPCRQGYRSPIDSYHPVMRGGYSSDFQCNVGSFFRTMFSDYDKHIAITATIKGYLILWSSKESCSKVDPVDLRAYLVKKSTKVVKVAPKSISCFGFVDNLIGVITRGKQISFFDNNLLLVNYVNLELSGCDIESISFDRHRVVSDPSKSNDSKVPVHKYEQLPSKLLDVCDVGPSGQPLSVRDCILSTTDGSCLRLGFETGVMQTIFNLPVFETCALAVVPHEDKIVIGGKNGSVAVYGHHKQAPLTSYRFPAAVSSVAVTDCGRYTAVGLANGELHLLHTSTLDPSQRHCHVSTSALEQCYFSFDSSYLITCDSVQVIDVYEGSVSSTNDILYALSSRFRGHYDLIVSLLWVPILDKHTRLLLSVSKDRRVVEYDLVGSTIERPKITRYACIEHGSAQPLHADWYPQCLRKGRYLIVANSEKKLRLINYTNFQCHRVMAVDSIGTPLNFVSMLPASSQLHGVDGEEVHAYMAVSSRERLGLQTLTAADTGSRGSGGAGPLTTVVAHVSTVKQISVVGGSGHAPGRWLWTIGGEGSDDGAFLWKAETGCLETSMLTGKEVSQEAFFFRQLSSDQWNHLQDVVYCHQIMDHESSCENEYRTEDSGESLQPTYTVPIRHVISILQSVGLRPTINDCEDMISELQHRDLSQCTDIDQVSLMELAALFCNYLKPGESHLLSRTRERSESNHWRSCLADALRSLQCTSDSTQTPSSHDQSGSLGKGEDLESLVIDRETLLKVLKSQGDCIDDGKELSDILTELLDPDCSHLLEETPLDQLELRIPALLNLNQLQQLLIGTEKNVQIEK